MRRTTLVAIALCVSSAAATAGAQSASDRETARHLMDEGYAALDKGNAKAALDRFVAADSLVHAPTTRLAIAKAQRKLGLLVEARETALDIVRAAPAPGEPRAFADARAEAQSMSDALADRIPSLRIVVKGVDGATVSVDGAAVPAASLVAPRRLDPGPHHVEARAGAQTTAADVTLAEGDARDVVLDLGAALPAAATGSAAPPPADTAAATAATSGADQPAESPAPGRGWRVASWIGLGVGAAGIAAGTVTGLLAVSAKNRALGGCVANRC